MTIPWGFSSKYAALLPVDYLDIEVVKYGLISMEGIS